MLSESQERMLMVLKPGREGEAETIFRKWELDFAVIGEVTDTGRMELVFDGEIVCRHPTRSAGGRGALLRAALFHPETARAADPNVPESTDITADLAEADGLTRSRQPALDLGAVRPAGRRRHGAASRAAMRRSCASTGQKRRWRSPPTARRATAMPIRSRAGSRRSPKPIATSARSAGSRWRSPTASTSATRSGPRSWSHVVGCIEGMGEACRALDFPVVSSNVDLSDETKNKERQPGQLYPPPRSAVSVYLEQKSTTTHSRQKTSRSS